MIYGNLRSTFSPKGQEYVTPWNPTQQLANALSGNSPLSEGTVDSPLSGTRSQGSPASGSSDYAQSNAPKGDSGISAGGGMPSFGLSAGYGAGRTGGAIGTGLGLATGGLGLGLAGNMIGTGIDTSRANASIGPNNGNQIGLGGYLSGVLNNATFGLMGENIGSQWGNALNAQSPYGMIDPQAGYDGGGFGGMADPFGNPAADPYGGVDPQVGGGGGYDGGGGGAASDPSAGGASDGSNDSGGSGFAKGGHVTRDRLHGPNPPGPDDGFAALDAGEYVIKASDVKKLGGPDKTRERLAKLLAGK